jgi:hypothetical protein
VITIICKQGAEFFSFDIEMAKFNFTTSLFRYSPTMDPPLVTGLDITLPKHPIKATETKTDKTKSSGQDSGARNPGIQEFIRAPS